MKQTHELECYVEVGTVVSRMINSGAIATDETGRPWVTANSISAARIPISWRGLGTVVSGTVSSRLIDMSL